MGRLAFICDKCQTTNLITDGVTKEDIIGKVVVCKGCGDDVQLTE